MYSILFTLLLAVNHSSCLRNSVPSSTRSSSKVTPLTYSTSLAPERSVAESSSSLQSSLTKALKKRKEEANLKRKTEKELAENSPVKASKPNREKVRLHSGPSNLVTVSSLVDFQTQLKENENNDELVTVVKFSAPWCRACKGITPSFYRFAHSCDTEENNVKKIKFIECQAESSNSEVHKALGVSVLPFAHVYKGGKLVEERVMSRKFYSTFESVVKAYMDGSCPLDEGDDFSSPYHERSAEDSSDFQKRLDRMSRSIV